MKINSTIEKSSTNVQTYPYIGEDLRDSMIVLFTEPETGIILNMGKCQGSAVGKEYRYIPEKSWYKPTAKHIILSNDLLT